MISKYPVTIENPEQFMTRFKSFKSFDKKKEAVSHAKQIKGKIYSLVHHWDQNRQYYIKEGDTSLRNINISKMGFWMVVK